MRAPVRSYGSFFGTAGKAGGSPCLRHRPARGLMCLKPTKYTVSGVIARYRQRGGGKRRTHWHGYGTLGGGSNTGLLVSDGRERSQVWLLRKTSGCAVDSLFISAAVALGSDNRLLSLCNGACYLLEPSLSPELGTVGAGRCHPWAQWPCLSCLLPPALLLSSPLLQESSRRWVQAQRAGHCCNPGKIGMSAIPGGSDWSLVLFLRSSHD